MKHQFKSLQAISDLVGKDKIAYVLVTRLPYKSKKGDSLEWLEEIKSKLRSYEQYFEIDLCTSKIPILERYSLSMPPPFVFGLSRGYIAMRINKKKDIHKLFEGARMYFFGESYDETLHGLLSLVRVLKMVYFIFCEDYPDEELWFPIRPSVLIQDEHFTCCKVSSLPFLKDIPNFPKKFPCVAIYDEGEFKYAFTGEQVAQLRDYLHQKKLG